jgi:hypothetical protein
VECVEREATVAKADASTNVKIVPSDRRLVLYNEQVFSCYCTFYSYACVAPSEFGREVVLRAHFVPPRLPLKVYLYCTVRTIIVRTYSAGTVQ